MRKKIVAGNWKMNKSLAEAKDLATAILNGTKDGVPENTKVILCASELYLLPIQEILGDNTTISLSAQNSAAYKEGAYTGETSPFQLTSSCIPFVLVGHSERRTLFGETDEVLKTKVDLALEAKLKPIFCCGEPKEIREAGTQDELVKSQIENALFHLSADQLQQVVIAYEPVWAIGTGLTASSQQAQDMHSFIRTLLEQKYGKAVSENISILYGGSVKASNAKELFDMPDVDGGLVGGASLNAAEFIQIIQCA